MQFWKQSLAFSVLLGLVGCGGVSTYPVSGTVNVDGKPVEGLLVAFSADGGGATAAGTTNAEGFYKLRSTLGPGLPDGVYRVSIAKITVVDNGTSTSSSDMATSSDSSAYESQALGSSRGAYRSAKKKNKGKLPAKYNSQSKLQETVAAIASNNIDFELSSK